MVNRVMPTARQIAALLLLAIADRRQRGKSDIRLRVSATSIRAISNRQRLPTELLTEVGDWLLTAGYALIDTGRTYGLVQTKAVEDWPRMGSLRIADTIDALKEGSPTKDGKNIDEYLDTFWQDQIDAAAAAAAAKKRRVTDDESDEDKQT